MTPTASLKPNISILPLTAPFVSEPLVGFKSVVCGFEVVVVGVVWGDVVDPEVAEVAPEAADSVEGGTEETWMDEMGAPEVIQAFVYSILLKKRGQLLGSTWLRNKRGEIRYIRSMICWFAVALSPIPIRQFAHDAIWAATSFEQRQSSPMHV